MAAFNLLHLAMAKSVNACASACASGSMYADSMCNVFSFSYIVFLGRSACAEKKMQSEMC